MVSQSAQPVSCTSYCCISCDAIVRHCLYAAKEAGGHAVLESRRTREDGHSPSVRNLRSDLGALEWIDQAMQN